MSRAADAVSEPILLRARRSRMSCFFSSAMTRLLHLGPPVHMINHQGDGKINHLCSGDAQAYREHRRPGIHQGPYSATGIVGKTTKSGLSEVVEGWSHKARGSGVAVSAAGAFPSAGRHSIMFVTGLKSSNLPARPAST